MPRVPSFPFTFIDGPGHTASGEEVMDNLDVLRDAYNDDATAGATLPTSPVDGQEYTYVVEDGCAWTFKYRSASALAYKWECIGGGDHYGTESDTQLPGDWGPLLGIPLPGIYVVEFGHRTWHSTDGAHDMILSLRSGAGSLGAATADARDVRAGEDLIQSPVMTAEVTMAAAGFIALTFASTDTQGRTAIRWMRIKPRCVS